MTKMTLKDRLNELVKSTFLGFIISVIVMYLKPELQTSILGIYGLMVGKRAWEIHSTSKSTKDVSNADK